MRWDGGGRKGTITRGRGEMGEEGGEHLLRNSFHYAVFSLSFLSGGGKG